MASNTPISVPLDDAAGALDPEVPAAKEGKRLSRRQIIARRFLRNKAAVLGAIGFALKIGRAHV